jgi:hypothetical protein
MTEAIGRMRKPRLLNGCCKSIFIAKYFEEHGWDAWTCDILPSEGWYKHIQDNILNHLDDGWDMGIFHPDCTYIANSGVSWLYRIPGRWDDMVRASEFFKTLWLARIPLIVMENPIPHHYAIDIIGKKYDQIIQPHEFGEDASKATCLWLKGVPRLRPTKHIEPHLSSEGKLIWGNQTKSGQNKLPPSDHRKADRSRNYEGISMAMAYQWRHC